MTTFILAMILATNLNRSGLPLLKESPALDKIAEIRAVQISQDFSHDQFLSVMQSSGYYKSAVFMGENLAYGFSGASSTESAFMKSPEHKANILNPFYREIGVATYHGFTVVEYGATLQDFLQ